MSIPSATDSRYKELIVKDIQYDMQANQPGALPSPDDVSAAHCAKCAEHIRAVIAASGGSISFGTYMQLALYAPGLGYYTAGNTKFGPDGDFITAPEVSPIFGRVLARQCADVLGSSRTASILEYGAGSGQLAVDVLKKLAELNALPARYRILDVSAELAERQRRHIGEKLPDLLPRIEWIDRPPEAHHGIVIANEVLDALPVERFTRRDKVMQHRVVVDGEKFELIEVEANDALQAAVAEIEAAIGGSLANGYVSEVSLAAKDWTAKMLASLSDGLALLFDYGVSRREYYAADRSDGWLRCHFRHRVHNDPLILPGIQDITAWVDFTRVAEAAADTGGEVAGYTSQAMFMIAGGLEEELAARETMGTADAAALSAAAKMLTLPGSMGEHFKCMCLKKGAAATPGVFDVADRTHTL